MDVLHDWPDAECATIPRGIRRAALSDARLLVVEAIVPDGPIDTRTATLDVLMLMLSGGRERTADELRVILAGAGFSLERVLETPDRCASPKRDRRDATKPPLSRGAAVAQQARDEDVGKPALVLLGGTPEPALLGVELRAGEREQRHRGLVPVQPGAAARFGEERGGGVVAALLALGVKVGPGGGDLDVEGGRRVQDLEDACRAVVDPPCVAGDES